MKDHLVDRAGVSWQLVEDAAWRGVPNVNKSNTNTCRFFWVNSGRSLVDISFSRSFQRRLVLERVCVSPVSWSRGYFATVSGPRAPQQILEENITHCWIFIEKNIKYKSSPMTDFVKNTKSNIERTVLTVISWILINTFSKLCTLPWKIFTHLSLGAKGRTSQIRTTCRDKRRSKHMPEKRDWRSLFFHRVKKKLPVLSMEFERRYDPSELRLSPVTESPWPCMLYISLFCLRSHTCNAQIFINVNADFGIWDEWSIH